LLIVSQFKVFATVSSAYQLLEELGASPQLIVHVKLVGEAAELLIAELDRLAIVVDKDFVRLGVAFHDAGKILHPAELTTKGNRHELDGESLLIDRGVDPALSRCCSSHGRWQQMACSLEELLVALADTLWKGKRNSQLEELVTQRLAARSDRDYWDLFIQIDDCCDRIAADGHLRLLRSQSSG
jgi:HD domain